MINDKKLFYIEEDLYQKLENKLNNADLVSALLITDTIKKQFGLSEKLLIVRARIYFLMKQYVRSAEEWFKYLSITKNEKSVGRAYNGLGACFYKLRDLNVAGYYFNRQILHNKKAVYEYSSCTAEFFEEMISDKNNYYLAYPYDKADFNILIEKAENKIKNGQYTEALNDLLVIPKTSKFYKSALITIAICKYFLNDGDGAKQSIEESVSIEKSVVGICNAVSIFASFNDNEKVEYYLSLLDEIKDFDDEDLYKAIMVYCEQNLHNKVELFCKKYLKNNEYNTAVLMLYGIALYNLKNISNAEKVFEKAYKIHHSYIIKYYINLCRNYNAKLSPKTLEYTFDIPRNERLKKVKLITELIKLESDKRVEREDEILQLSEYAFSSLIYQIQSSAITLIGEVATEKTIEKAKQILLETTVFDRIKSGIIGFLTADGFEGSLGAVFSNIYKEIVFHKANFNGNKTFIEAYAYLYAKIAPLENDLLPLKESAERAYNKMSEKGLLDSNFDVRSLSAYIYEASVIAKIKSRREFASFFDANLREIKKIKELLNN